jgi:TonB family protein
MMVLLTYLIKVNVALGLFYGFYRLLFREDTFLRGRRAALLALVLVAVGYPFINITWGAPDYGPLWRELLSGVTPVYTLPEVVVLGTAEAEGVSLLSRWPEMLLGLYGLAAGGLLVRILVQTGIIAGVVIRSQTLEIHGIRVRQCRGMRTPFSFFRWIVLDTTLYTDTELREILRHEETHVREGHSFDILLAELLCVVCWFNPFAWFLKREIQLNLEFLADRSVLASGYEAEHYQFHLLRLTYHKAAAKMVNNFNVSLLKKRIFMMNKKQTSKLSIVKYTLLVPVVGMLVFFNGAFRMQAGSVGSDGNVPVEMWAAVEGVDVPAVDLQDPPSKPMELKGKVVIVRDTSEVGTGDVTVSAVTDPVEPKMENGVYDHSEEMPRFPGGDQAMLKFLQANIQYPVSAQEAAMQGRVIVRFVVGEDGAIRDVEVTRSLDPACDAEAVRVIKKMPKWTPGKVKGEPVAVYYVLPVMFKLSGGKKDATPPPPPPILKEGVYQQDGQTFVVSKVTPQEDGLYRMDVSFAPNGKGPFRFKVGAAQDGDSLVVSVGDNWLKEEKTEGFPEVIYEVDGKVIPHLELSSIDPKSIESITVLREPKPGRVLITLKKK